MNESFSSVDTMVSVSGNDGFSEPQEINFNVGKSSFHANFSTIKDPNSGEYKVVCCINGQIYAMTVDNIDEDNIINILEDMLTGKKKEKLKDFGKLYAFNGGKYSYGQGKEFLKNIINHYKGKNSEYIVSRLNNHIKKSQYKNRPIKRIVNISKSLIQELIQVKFNKIRLEQIKQQEELKKKEIERDKFLEQFNTRFKTIEEMRDKKKCIEEIDKLQKDVWALSIKQGFMEGKLLKKVNTLREKYNPNFKKEQKQKLQQEIFKDKQFNKSIPEWVKDKIREEYDPEFRKEQEQRRYEKKQQEEKIRQNEQNERQSKNIVTKINQNKKQINQEVEFHEEHRENPIFKIMQQENKLLNKMSELNNKKEDNVLNKNTIISYDKK